MLILSAVSIFTDTGYNITGVLECVGIVISTVLIS